MLEPEEKKWLRIRKTALLEELQNENPDMSDSELDVYDPDYEMKRIDKMEKQLNFNQKRMLEEKVGSKTVETKEKIKTKKREEKAKRKAKL